MREKLIELLKSGGVRDFPFNAALADHLIANDVVPVVRCKDCKHYIEDASISPDFVAHYCNCHGTDYSFMPQDFCSCGERRTDG